MAEYFTPYERKNKHTITIQVMLRNNVNINIIIETYTIENSQLFLSTVNVITTLIFIHTDLLKVTDKNISYSLPKYLHFRV